MRVYAAGSVANITVALIALILVSLISVGIPYYFSEDGIEIDRVVGDSPADGILKQGMVLESIDNHQINDSQESYGYCKLHKQPGDNVTVQTDQGSYTLTLDKNPNKRVKRLFWNSSK